MLDSKSTSRTIKVDLYGQPSSQDEIELNRKQLKSVNRDHLNYILALVTLAAGVTYRALSFEYDQLSELLKISLTIGMWIGLFTGFMTSGDPKHRFHLIFIGIVVSTAASLLGSMLMTLFVAHVTVWITSINILASALACMWVLTYYDEVITGIDSLKTVSLSQAKLIEKAADHFEELEIFKQKISKQGRRPVIGEYWAIQDWLEANKT